jgi:coenzyme Q-binding protein COQ10
MGLVKAQVVINAPRDKVFALAQRVEEFPSFMPDVEDVEILSRDNSSGVARVKWIAKVEVGSISKKVRWIEEERWDSKAMKGEFDQVEGDYKFYNGEWDFITDQDGKTVVTLEIDFDLGLPLVGRIIGKLLDKLMYENIQGMLNALKKKVEQN